MSAAIVWFRRDLRLIDHPALDAAVQSGLPVIALYVHAPEEEGHKHNQRRHGDHGQRQPPVDAE